MLFYINDTSIPALVATLAAERGMKTQEAVRLAVPNELGRNAAAVPLRARIAAWHLVHKLPPATGLVADKRFFDEVSGET